MSDIVKVNCSGGKDSTTALFLHIDKGHFVKAVCYIPMLTDDIPLLLKSHFDFLYYLRDVAVSCGASFSFVHGVTYYDFCLTRSSRGDSKGRIFGFPCPITGACGFKRDSKLRALSSFDVGSFDYEDIGIAFDEVERYSVLSSLKRSILVENEYCESDCFSFCRSRSLLSPHYSFFSRDGCSLCPHASRLERSLYFKDYPQAVDIVFDLQSRVSAERPGIFPLRDYRMFLERTYFPLYGEEILVVN